MCVVLNFSDFSLCFLISYVPETAKERVVACQTQEAAGGTELVPGVFTEGAGGILVGGRFHLNGE